uniref:PA14 domain-containing protein n=1 Tax=Hanusia phi TaxID=3032 RepID=A0A7S0EYP9_9CRYP
MAPNLPPPSSFTIRMYQAETEELTYTPDLAFLNFVQDGKTAFIDFHDLEDFRSAVPNTPSYNYVWAIYGNLDVQKAGTYTFCTISDDGSLMYVDGRLVVNNDGLHGAQESCGGISLSAGTHAMFLPGFQHYGAAYMSAHYYGPDTGRVKRYLRSDSSKAPDPPKPSAWTLRMFKGSGIQNMAQANWRFLTFVGEKTVRDVYVPNNQEFVRLMPGMPDNNFVWVYYGTVAISAPGVYSFCSTSDDGSYLFVDDSLLVDNDGLHGGERRCGSVRMAPGNHAVRIEGFNHYGGAYQDLDYAGPDTRDQYRHMVSLPTAAPPLPPPSQWLMRMYRTNYEPFELVPDVSHMTYVGEAVISYIAFSTLQELRNWIPGTPEAKYAWQVYGKVRIMIPGTYSFCSQSDDGSLVYFGSTLVVNNDGLHGADKRCGSISLSAGDHDVVVVGFQNYGGVYQVFSYSGPDTRGVERWTPSVSAAGPPDKGGKAGQFGNWPPS